MTRTTPPPTRVAISSDTERPMGETTRRRLCDLVEDLHPDDKRQVFNRLAAAILAEQHDKIPVIVGRGNVVGYLVSMGEYLGVTATTEQDEQLAEALATARSDK